MWLNYYHFVKKKIPNYGFLVQMFTRCCNEGDLTLVLLKISTKNIEKQSRCNSFLFFPWETATLKYITRRLRRLLGYINSKLVMSADDDM